MKWSISSYMLPDSAFRRRSVHLLYLVFLIIIFSFIPNTGREHDAGPLPLSDIAQWNLEHSQAQALLFLQLLDPATPEYNELKFDLLSFEKWGTSSLHQIRALEAQLSEDKTISQKESGTLFSHLQRFRTEVSKKPYGLDEVWVEQLLPLSRYVEDQRGMLREYHTYYFGRNGRDAQMRYLQDLEKRVTLTRSMANQQTIRQRASEYPELNQLLVQSTAPLKFTDLYRTTGLSPFLLDHEPTPAVRTSKGGDIEYTLYGGTELVQGEAIHFDLTANGGEAVTVRISGPAGTEVFRMLETGPFLFYPSVNGVYHLRLSGPSGQLQEQFRVRSGAELSLAPDQALLSLDRSYQVPLPGEVAPFHAALFFDTENTQVLQTAQEVRLQGQMAGSGRLKVGIHMAYGDIIVAEYTYRFDKRSPAQVGFTVGDEPGALQRASLTEMVRLEGIAPADLLISGYRINLLPAASGRSIQVRYNPGARLSTPNALLLQNSQAGDRVLIDGIKAVNAEGRSVQVAPLVLRIL